MRLHNAIAASLATVCLWSQPGALRAQATAAPASAAVAGLVLQGADGQARTISPDDFARLPHRDTTVSAHRVTGRYSGVSLLDLLALVHAPAGDSIRGKALAMYVLVVGADGYRVVFSIAELAPAFGDRLALLTDRKDGAPLPSGEGPYRLIVPGEQRPARWVRQVTRIEVQRVPER